MGTVDIRLNGARATFENKDIISDKTRKLEIDSNIENTMFVADSTYGDLNRIIVYPRKVKGA